MKEKLKKNRYELITEISTWLILVAVIFGVRFLPTGMADNDTVFLLIGIIAAFALFYYLIIFKYFAKTKRAYIKNIADIVLIGILIHLLKDYGKYFFALYFIPIAAAALSLEFINALLIATVAAVIVVFDILLSSQGVFGDPGTFLQGVWQIGIILFITIFCRILAIQIKQERSAKEESLAREKALEEQTSKTKEFLSLTSHQLYTPLSLIRGFVSMLKDETLGKLNPKQKDAVNEIHENARRMVSLVSELLSISRIQSGTLEIKKMPTDLARLARKAVKSFQETMGREGLEITAEIPDLQPLNIDGDKIRNCLYNLLDNAIKYTKKGKITVSIQQNPAETIVKVSDSGVGLNQEDFKGLFQPFFRGTNILEFDNQGSGLGLYIARLIVERHGGKIWAENNSEGGATFCFSLPMFVEQPKDKPVLAKEMVNTKPLVEVK